MKKLLVLAVVIVGVALLPLIGNKVVKETIENRLQTLSSYGLSSKLVEEKKGYLQTTLKYEFQVSDKEKFVRYLQQFSSKQLPPYTQNLLDGVAFGANLTYSNIPLSETLSIDLYPTALPSEIMQEVSKKEPKVAKVLEDILTNKEIVYHIEYAVVNGEFQGRLKDFVKSVEFTNGNSVDVELIGVEANGKGMLLAPDRLDTKLNRLVIKANDKSAHERIIFEVKNVTSSTLFQTDTTFTSKMDIHSFHMSFEKQKRSQKFDVNFLDLQLQNSVNTQGEKASAESEVSFKKLTLSLAPKSLELQDLVLKIALEDVEKKSYIKLQKIFEKISIAAQVTPEDEKALQESIEAILADGFTLKIPNFSLAKLSVDKQKSMDGFHANMVLDLQGDRNIHQELQTNPDALIENLLLHANIALSKDFYALLNEIYPVDLMLANLKKEQNSEVVFEIEMQGKTLKVNNKPIR